MHTAPLPPEPPSSFGPILPLWVSRAPGGPPCTAGQLPVRCLSLHGDVHTLVLLSQFLILSLSLRFVSLTGHHLCGGTWCFGSHYFLPLLPVLIPGWVPVAQFQALPDDGCCPQPWWGLDLTDSPCNSPLAHRSTTLKHKLENITADGKRDWRRKDCFLLVWGQPHLVFHWTS